MRAVRRADAPSPSQASVLRTRAETLADRPERACLAARAGRSLSRMEESGGDCPSGVVPDQCASCLRNGVIEYLALGSAAWHALAAVAPFRGEVLMPHRLKSRLAKSWLIAACLVIGLIAPSGASAEPSSKACNARANDTPNKLLPCIKTADLWAHMQAFQNI